jgi:hypothetical protein
MSEIAISQQMRLRVVDCFEFLFLGRLDSLLLFFEDAIDFLNVL